MALANPPDPQQPVVRPSDGRVDEDWYRWFLDFVLFCQQLFVSLGDLEDDVNGIELDDDWCDHIPRVVDGDIVVQQKAQFSGTIPSVVTDCASGTCTATVKINGTVLGGTANSVSSTEQTQSHSTDNEFAVGDVISYTISANSACLNARVQINYTRPLVEPA